MSNKRTRTAGQKWFSDFKRTCKCAVCGESESCCLDFHHIKNKRFTVSNAAKQGYSIESIKQEIAKCIVLCANCHRKHHSGLLVQREDTSLAPMGWGFDSPEVHQFLMFPHGNLQEMI
jgi:hypothetical protein